MPYYGEHDDEFRISLFETSCCLVILRDLLIRCLVSY